MKKDKKVTRIEGTDTPVNDGEWSNENREKAYSIADLLSAISGKKVTPKFMKRGKDGAYREEESQ
jgi:hypothetical protein